MSQESDHERAAEVARLFFGSPGHSQTGAPATPSAGYGTPVYGGLTPNYTGHIFGSPFNDGFTPSHTSHSQESPRGGWTPLRPSDPSSSSQSRFDAALTDEDRAFFGQADTLSTFYPASDSQENPMSLLVHAAETVSASQSQSNDRSAEEEEAPPVASSSRVSPERREPDQAPSAASVSDNDEDLMQEPNPTRRPSRRGANPSNRADGELSKTRLMHLPPGYVAEEARDMLVDKASSAQFFVQVMSRNRNDYDHRRQLESIIKQYPVLHAKRLVSLYDLVDYMDTFEDVREVVSALYRQISPNVMRMFLQYVVRRAFNNKMTASYMSPRSGEVRTVDKHEILGRMFPPLMFVSRGSYDSMTLLVMWALSEHPLDVFAASGEWFEPFSALLGTANVATREAMQVSTAGVPFMFQWVHFVAAVFDSQLRSIRSNPSTGAPLGRAPDTLSRERDVQDEAGVRAAIHRSDDASLQPDQQHVRPPDNVSWADMLRRVLFVPTTFSVPNKTFMSVLCYLISTAARGRFYAAFVILARAALMYSRHDGFIARVARELADEAVTEQILDWWFALMCSRMSDSHMWDRVQASNEAIMTKAMRVHPVMARFVQYCAPFCIQSSSALALRPEVHRRAKIFNYPWHEMREDWVGLAALAPHYIHYEDYFAIAAYHCNPSLMAALLIQIPVHYKMTKRDAGYFMTHVNRAALHIGVARMAAYLDAHLGELAMTDDALVDLLCPRDLATTHPRRRARNKEPAGVENDEDENEDDGEDDNDDGAGAGGRHVIISPNPIKHRRASARELARGLLSWCRVELPIDYMRIRYKNHVYRRLGRIPADLFANPAAVLQDRQQLIRAVNASKTILDALFVKDSLPLGNVPDVPLNYAFKYSSGRSLTLREVYDRLEVRMTNLYEDHWRALIRHPDWEPDDDYGNENNDPMLPLVELPGPEAV